MYQLLKNNMSDIKDTVANAATIGGGAGMVWGWNEVLTLVLIITGIIFNIVRIYEIRRSRKKNK